MRINKENINKIIESSNQEDTKQIVLKDKVIQFGTGVLLRGLPDYYIDNANKNGTFDGSIVLIKSTNHGDTSAFNEQDNLYTIQTEGIKNGKIFQQQDIVNCISKVLIAKDDWNQILELAEDLNIEFIISNTTESGIVEIAEDLNSIPSSYPGKLAALLYRRFMYTQGNIKKGFIILPTELIDNNANKLKEIVISISRKNNLSSAFIEWIEDANHFCNTLVDRIVPGKIKTIDWQYQDELAIAVEPFNLWAIEIKNPSVKKRISFAKSNPGIKLIDSIKNIKELKLRLLNATHTLLCPIAILAKHDFVRQTLDDSAFQKWTEDLMQTEITQHLLTQNLTEGEINDFASSIIDRFKNPFIDHKWLAIAQNSTQKWIQRVIPILNTYNTLNTESTNRIALSIAAYLKCHQLANDIEFPIDGHIKNALDRQESIPFILSQKHIWTIDLSTNSSFTELVTKHYQELNTTSIFHIIN